MSCFPARLGRGPSDYKKQLELHWVDLFSCLRPDPACRTIRIDRASRRPTSPSTTRSAQNVAQQYCEFVGGRGVGLKTENSSGILVIAEAPASAAAAAAAAATVAPAATVAAAVATAARTAATARPEFLRSLFRVQTAVRSSAGTTSVSSI